jgi:hypothetical protein
MFLQCQARPSGLPSRTGTFLVIGDNRQGKVKATTLPQYTLCPNPSAMLFDNAFTDRQAKPGAPLLAGVRHIHLLETFEDGLQPVSGDASPLILHGK